MNRHFILSLLSLIVAFGALIYCYLLSSKLERVVVIDVLKTVSEFNMKKDLENQAEAKLLPLKNKVDSLNAIGDYLIKNSKAISENFRNELTYWQQTAQESYEISNNTINEQVWKRLNPLIDKFGKERKYRLIVGANGMGTVLYNEEGIDKTDELIVFINSNYATGEK